MMLTEIGTIQSTTAGAENAIVEGVVSRLAVIVLLPLISVRANFGCRRSSAIRKQVRG